MAIAKFQKCVHFEMGVIKTHEILIKIPYLSNIRCRQKSCMIADNPILLWMQRFIVFTMCRIGKLLLNIWRRRKPFGEKLALNLKPPINILCVVHISRLRGLSFKNIIPPWFMDVNVNIILSVHLPYILTQGGINVWDKQTCRSKGHD